jgi:hypothetical protein
MLGSVRLKLRRHPLIIFLLISFQVSSFTNANATGTVVFSALTASCNGNTIYTGNIYAHRYLAGSTGIVTALNVLEMASAQNSYSSAFSSSKYFIMADAGSAKPSVILETFTASALTSTNAKYVGSYSVTAGTKFWIVPGQAFSTFPACYFWANSLPNVNVVSSNNWQLDTSTNTSWGYISGPTVATLSTVSFSNFLFALSIELGASTPIEISLSISSGAQAAVFRQPVSLRATLNADGKVTFFQSGKPISGCRNIRTISLVATCNWKPSVHGAVAVSASATPVGNSFTANSSTQLVVGVATRTTLR